MPRKLDASVAMLNVPSDDVGKTSVFYTQLLGIELIESLEDEESFHAPVSEDGIDLLVGPRRYPGETPMVYFHVDDLDARLDNAKNSGGKVLWGPEEISMSDDAFKAYEKVYKEAEPRGAKPSKQLCRAAVVQDPGGSMVGLMSVADHMHDHFQVGRHQKPITDKQLSHMKRSEEAVRLKQGR